MARLWKNNAFSTVAAAMDAGTTTLQVAVTEGDRFPVASIASGNYYHLTIQDASNNYEVMKVVDHQAGTDTFTVVRGQESTSGQAWVIGDIVEMRLTAAALSEFATKDGEETLTNKTLTSPTFTGSVNAPTVSVGTRSTLVATTEYVQTELDALVSVPSGIIAMWSGAIANIPNGWALCDGNNGTPDLRDRFVVGAGSTYAEDDIGGSANAPLVSHTHSVSISQGGTHNHGGSTGASGSHNHGLGGLYDLNNSAGGAGNRQGGFAGGQNVVGRSSTQDGGNHTHSLSIQQGGLHSHSVTVGNTGSGDGTGANLPPYYALAYIMKT